MNEEAARKVWAVLVAELGVYNDEKGRQGDTFVWSQTRGECMEYRIGGKLGFGGKFRNYSGRWYVDCYREDLTPARQQMIDAANVKLAELRAEFTRNIS